LPLVYGLFNLMFDYQIVGRFEVYQKFADWNLPDHEQILFHPVLKLQAI